jgi:hypothetical protein
MSSRVEDEVLARIVAAPVVRQPFAHCIIDDIFPAEFFESILDHWPEEQSWQGLGESGRVAKDKYRERLVVLMDEDGFSRLDRMRREFWQRAVGQWLLGTQMRRVLLEKFDSELRESGFGASLEHTKGDALIVSDRTDYEIGPHTDAAHRVVSLLFYLPEDATFRRFGTGFYVPRDPSFRCRGGPHHPFGVFRRESTVEFVPNRLVIFPKTDRCFHGVEAVDLPGIERRLLIYNLRRTT